MQDRYKFRVYSPTQEVYADVESIDYAKGLVTTVCGETFKIDDVVLLPCTGVKDKNDKLIYEGDILNNPSWWWGCGFVYSNYGECSPCKADSVIGQYILCHNIENPKLRATYNLWNGKDVEIIGNKFQNADLFE